MMRWLRAGALALLLAGIVAGIDFNAIYGFDQPLQVRVAPSDPRAAAH
jgi:hypothetical protein